MSVIFHIATGRDWERATSSGTYATESLHREGIIGCSSAAQHAAVANRRFTGRTDLVLLLIDTDKLQSEVHIEQAEADGQPLPRVDGPVNLDAVFEATPYQPGANGRFHPHQEASGFATHGMTTLDQTRRRALEVMAGYRGPWWVAGGWALDLLLGAKTRPHVDLQLSVLAADQWALFEHLRGWDLRLAAPGARLPRWDGSRIPPPFHQVWARRGPGRPSTAEEFAADPTMLGFLLEQGSTDRWVFRRHPRVTRPLRQLGRASADGVPFVAPEVALLFKAKTPRFKDRRDFDRVLPYLDGAARAWLAWALEQAGRGRDHLPPNPHHPQPERGRLRGDRLRADPPPGDPRGHRALHRHHQLPARADGRHHPADNAVDLAPSSTALRLLAPLAAPRVKAAVAANLDTLRQVLETGQPTASSAS